MQPTDKKRIPVSSLSLSGREKEYVLDCMESTWISSLGKYVDAFEMQFATYVNRTYAIACSNGTTALHLALLGLDIGVGDEVICPTFTYVATANSISYVRATPVFVDCEPDTFNINPQKIEEKITSKTKAIIIVPLYGHPCEYDQICAIAKKHNVLVIEDSAEAFGASYRGEPCGSFGDISTFSFYGNKTITTGEGGMLVTNHSAVAKKVRLYKDQAMDTQKRYWFPVVGYNYRMTNIQAAIGLAQLEQADQFLEKRKHIAEVYNRELAVVTDIVTPVEKDYAKHAYWMYCILTPDMNDRDKLMAYLHMQGIDTRPFFYPMHILPMYEETSIYPVADDIAGRGINLPTYFNLSDDDIIYICNAIKQYYAYSA